ncbi:transmembrane protein 62-like [Argiope bruennichi]|uniref:transmembrane protein 62-like n=1 Tax=Argiope bruennichi TaxID=94029 RepID=UPI002494D8B0|nr:transmembrane protein 62-like [Argiope bruennichi]
MSLSKITLFVLATLAVISTLVAKLQNIVHISNDVEYDDIKVEYYQDDLYPNDKRQHLMWFLQVSDLHLSIFKDLSRGSDLKKFCNETVSVIRPSVVLATGDLVDSRTADLLGSRQYVEEWRMYQQILYDSGVTVNTTWLDIRGNHDNFNVLSLDDKNDLYRKYSTQGGKHRRSYSYTLQQGTETYTFIGIDACMDPGPKRPFNFLGVLKKDEYSHVKKLLDDSRGGNMTIWFGHYPTSTIVAPNPGIRELMKGTGPYLCGHLHTLGGMVPEMYTLQSTGALELELADWKDRRKYRICAVDHGIFSFFDNHIEDWPLILVTNPKDAMMLMPAIEPLYRVMKSTHIRVLIFSPYPIALAKVKINDDAWIELKLSEAPLYVAKWEPLKYMEGLYTMTVYAKDTSGKERIINHQFSLDNSRPTFPLTARLALMGHISVGQAIFGVSLLITLLPLCIMKIYLCFGKGEGIKLKSERGFCRRMIFKFSLLANVDILFWPVVIGALYVAVGPWFVGYIIDDHIGVCFVWGIFLGGTFLPGGLQYFAGTLYLVTFYIPFILCLSNCLYLQYKSIRDGRPKPCSLYFYVCRHFLMLFFILWQSLWAVVYFFSYGTLAFFLGFTHTWSVVMALILWRIVIILPESKINSIGRPRQVVGTPLLPSNQANKRLSPPTEEIISPS